MSAGNITKYVNGTSLNERSNDIVGISFFETVLLTLFVITSVILFSALAYYMVRKRALKKMRHHLVPLYHFDPGEFDNWEDELLEDSMEGRKKSGHDSRVVHPKYGTFPHKITPDGDIRLKHAPELVDIY